MTPTKIIVARCVFITLMIGFFLAIPHNPWPAVIIWIISGWIAFEISSRHKISKWHSSNRMLQGLVISLGLISLGGLAFFSSMGRARIRYR